MSTQKPSAITPLLPKDGQPKTTETVTATALDAKAPDVSLILGTLATNLTKFTEETKDSQFPSDTLRTKVATKLKANLEETKISTPQAAKDFLWPHLQATQAITFMASYEHGCACYLCTCCWGKLNCTCVCVSNPLLNCTLCPPPHPSLMEIPPPIRQSIEKEHKIVTKEELCQIRTEERQDKLPYEKLIEKDPMYTLIKDAVKAIDPDDAIKKRANAPDTPFCTSCICCD